MSATLREILLHKCRKKLKRIQSYDEEEEWEETEETINNLENVKSIEELPLEDILAEKRRKYTIEEEFTFLLYNDLLQFFLKEWDGEILRKKPKNKIDDDNESVNELKNNDTDYKEHNEETSKSNSNMYWKMTAPDEFANIKFISNNTYTGRISRKMMEGKGVYRWSNGAQYKGDFEQNRMHGKGLLEWNSNCWYEGDFVNGYRHGRGIMVDGENRYMYTGIWYMGQRHGKGYCRYGDNSSYDGDWVMDKMHGVGLRTYTKGSYYGQWKNGLRDGRGTMVWTNGNVYRGEWKCGAMHGYGEYVWNAFFNKTLTWPQEALYVGNWRNGMRNGEGELKLSAVGGAKYFGHWKDNKKHGYGVIIGSNGEKFESNPLFLNDILCTSNVEDNDLNNELEDKDEIKCVRVIKEMKPQFLDRSTQLEKAPIIPILKPEQFPSLSYYITRLFDPDSLEVHPLLPILSGKCYSCENESCTCLAVKSIDSRKQNENDKEATDIVEEETNVSEFTVNNIKKSDWEYEERWTHNCLILHMARLREIYNNYAKLFTNSAPKCDIAMSRLCLWQLWSDCGIHKKGLSLIEIDNYIAKNKITFVQNPHDPFEKIEIWQYLHALLEVSWHLYTKFGDIETEEINGKLAGGLHNFLKNDIYPHTGNHIGSLCQENQDLLPIYAVFKLCKRIGYPFSMKDLLQTMCVLNDTTDPQTSITTETIKSLSNGINCTIIGEKINYLLKSDDIFMESQCTIQVSRNDENDHLSHGLSVFGELGPSKLLEIMALICPAIKDIETDMIINMDYELTFLEFYEIILEATKQLLVKKKLQMKELETEDASSQKNNNLQKIENFTTIKRSSVRKSFKINKNKT
ncbi:uncharacterized protein LOC117608151 isoform X2 [Osmia lignaria lignaria]|uniref:uncharacterized protein LOC117608151 isoform X2 n=1 Tax=Osmia lignaria lignaria TaxID=1437193 RepID=UPI0014784F4C|nr:radial spoke head 10 homolog B-like isoform X2 [Osmia lignaria]